MKEKVSISLNRETVKNVDKRLADGKFRNRSHFIEYAVRKMLGDE